jgi:hypothetical protein
MYQIYCLILKPKKIMILEKIKIAVFSSLCVVLANSNVKAQCSSPSLVTASPAQLCAPGGTTNLNATSNIGTSIAWYTVAVGGTSLGSVPSGSNFNVNSASTTTFYAEAFLVNSNNNQVFNYTGAIQNFTIPVSGTYTIQAWGSQGWTGSQQGGKGGYAIGTISLNAGQVINIYVGGQGTTASNSIPSGAGWNGGGNGYAWYNGLNYGGGGGGASDIRIGGTAFSNRILVAGGGGGSNNNGGAFGGFGGGLIGGNGGSNCFGIGGSQISGGNANCGATALTIGSLGQGGTGNTVGWTGGGGGGYYGGAGAGDHSGAGGGSSYIGGVNNGSTIAGNASMPNPIGGSNIIGKNGNGAIRISWQSTSCISAQRTPVTLTIFPQPTLSITGSNIICSGNSVNLSASGANTYTWSNSSNANNISISPFSNTTYSLVGRSLEGCLSSNVAILSVTVNPNPIITVNNGVICAGQNFTINPNGANTYTIQGGSSVVSPTSNASFTVAGTSTAGCLSQAFATSNLTVNPNPTITVNNGTICVGQNFTINPNGANTYTIQGGNAVVSPPSNTSFTVIGTNSATGCRSQAFATSSLIVNPNPLITVNNGTICAGQNFTINPNGANTYTIQGGIAVVSPAGNTSYTVAGTSTAGCVSQAVATSSLIVNQNPTITVNNGAICAGENFTINPNGANTYTIQGGSAVVSPAGNTSYTVAGTSAAGCLSQAFATSNLTVNPNPTVSISGSSGICTGQNASLTANGATNYTWSTGSTGASVVFSPSATSVYSVVGSYSTGCLNATTQTVTVYTLPVVSLSGPSVVCLGNSISLVANGANTYVWNNNATTTTIVITPTTTSTYSAVGTDTNGCVGLSASKSVTVNPLPILSIISTATAICLGDTVKFTAAGANSYAWNIGDNDSLIVVTPTITTTYSVVGTNGFGCTSTKTDSVKVNALPNITISGATGTICIGENITITANGANTYTWSGGINTNSIAVSPSVSTTYSATGTSTDGCVGSNTLQVIVSQCTSINIIASKTEFKVYPNPNNGEFTIELTNINNSNITITNVLGQIIKTQKAELMNQIDLNLFDKGIYFINVMENNQSVYRSSIIKQ